MDKLTKNGFIELKWDKGVVAAPHGNAYQATLTGNGAIAQGPGATAVGARGVYVGGKNAGNINTGTQTIDTGGGAYSLLAVVAQKAPADKQAAAVKQVEELKAEVAKGKQADDSKVGRIVDGLVAMVPSAIGAVVSIFATPILGGIAGPATNSVLDKLKGS